MKFNLIYEEPLVSRNESIQNWRSYVYYTFIIKGKLKDRVTELSLYGKASNEEPLMCGSSCYTYMSFIYYLKPLVSLLLFILI